MRKTKYFALLSATALTFTLTACADNSADDQTEETTPQTTVVETTENQTENDQSDDAKTPAGITPFADTEAGIDAVKAAQEVNGGKAFDLDREDSDQIWEIHVLEGDEDVEYHVSADGTVKEHERESIDADEKAYITDAMDITKAIEMAAGNVSDGYLDEVDLDEDDGKVYYEISFDDADGKDLKDIALDYKTGDILEVENED